MNKELALAWKEYIDAKIEEEFAYRQVGGDDYYTSPINERKNRQRAWDKIIAIIAKFTEGSAQ